MISISLGMTCIESFERRARKKLKPFLIDDSQRYKLTIKGRAMYNYLIKIQKRMRA